MVGNIVKQVTLNRLSVMAIIGGTLKVVPLSVLATGYFGVDECFSYASKNLSQIVQSCRVLESEQERTWQRALPPLAMSFGLEDDVRLTEETW